MSLLKYLERAKRIDDLIRRKATGGAEEFSHKMGISRSVLMEHLRDMKALGAPIRFCETRNSYYYEKEFDFIISSRRAMSKMVGGKLSSGPVWPDSHLIDLSRSVTEMLASENHCRGC
jgi:hypothetical protein